jgi:hypothetical protein
MELLSSKTDPAIPVEAQMSELLLFVATEPEEFAFKVVEVN